MIVQECVRKTTISDTWVRNNGNKKPRSLEQGFPFSSRLKILTSSLDLQSL